MRTFVLLVLLLTISPFIHGQQPLKDHSVLYPPAIAEKVRQNVQQEAWAAAVRDRVVEAAAFWQDKSDDELWSYLFNPAMERSWMVWSNGYSPITGQPVPMYNWVVDAQAHPWKLQDPTSGEWFPKNDFEAFHKSGLNEQGLFDPAKADRSLLFNTEHPDPNDPLHLFGVDDGTGYVNEKSEKWRFIATYLIYGHWKQLIVNGVRILSAAHLLTGEPIYAHKTGVLLDRVADLYPQFDFKTQGVLYEGPASAGYVSTWHDTCEETRELVMGYDMVFEALRNDQELVQFLSRKAAEIGLENKKASFADIQRNIEGGLLRDALAHPEKIYSNYPRNEILKAVTTAVLQEPEEAFWALVDPMLEKSTAVDGVTGEKGLGGYSSFTISALASFLSEFSKANPQFLTDTIQRHPRLKETYKFFMDVMCLGRYYPQIGDTGHYATVMDRYVGIDFLKPGENLTGWGNWTLLSPSNFKLLYRLYEITGDPSYVQLLYSANNGTVEGLPYDLYGDSPAEFQKAVMNVIRREGTLLRQKSVNKQEWHLGILRSGEGGNERALWLDYDAGGGHGHRDGMNLGLFAFGLDLLPELGYPPVQFGGWDSPRSRWYMTTAAHNTVVVNKRNQKDTNGATRFWFDGNTVHALAVTGEALGEVSRYERTVAMIDVDDDSFYIVDVFRVRGGNDHTKFMQSHYGPLSTTGLNLAPAEDFENGTQMRNFMLDPAAAPGWQAAWQIEDRNNYLAEPRPVALHYWDFTNNAAAGTCEMWFVAGLYEETREIWGPRLVVRHQGPEGADLETTFVSIFEPFSGQSAVLSARRLPVANADGTDTGDTEVALEITLANGETDVLLLRDVARMAAQPAAAVQQLHTDAALGFARTDSDGKVLNAALAQGATLTMPGLELKATNLRDAAELQAP